MKFTKKLYHRFKNIFFKEKKVHYWTCDECGKRKICGDSKRYSAIFENIRKDVCGDCLIVAAKDKKWNKYYQKI